MTRMSERRMLRQGDGMGLISPRYLLLVHPRDAIKVIVSSDGEEHVYYVEGADDLIYDRINNNNWALEGSHDQLP